MNKLEKVVREHDLAGLMAMNNKEYYEWAISRTKRWTTAKNEGAQMAYREAAKDMKRMMRVLALQIHKKQTRKARA